MLERSTRAKPIRFKPSGGLLLLAIRWFLGYACNHQTSEQKDDEEQQQASNF
jgi:hypothetical protein